MYLIHLRLLAGLEEGIGIPQIPVLELRTFGLTQTLPPPEIRPLKLMGVITVDTQSTACKNGGIYIQW